MDELTQSNSEPVHFCHQNSAKRFQIHAIFNLLAGKDTLKARGETRDLLVKNFVPTVKATWAEEADREETMLRVKIRLCCFCQP